MRLSLLQLEARFGDPSTVLAEADALLSRSPTDLVLLPECALTGYVSPGGDFDLSGFAEPFTGPTPRALGALAEAHRCYVVGPWVLAQAKRNSNAIGLFGPTGKLLDHYEKRHPWFPETWAHPGNRPFPLWEVGELRFTLAICYDIHFVAEEAAAELEAADVLLFPSAWVDDDEHDAREAQLRMLAREFRIVVANANWATGDVAIGGQGSSRFFFPDGSIQRLPAGDVMGAPQRLDTEVLPNRLASGAGQKA